MHISKAQKDSINKSFQNIDSKDDLLDLCNYVKKIIYKGRYVPFELRHLNFHSNYKLNSKRYIAFEVKKKDGSSRTIHAPNKGLKSIQYCLNHILQCVFTPANSTFGFVPGRSIVDNARVHTGNIYVYNIDLKDFFPSIDQPRIWGRLQHPPFNLSGSVEKVQIAGMIAGLCCHRMEVIRHDNNGNKVTLNKNVLPQGAPTSPVLSNIVCQRLDYYLSAMARKFGLKFSRYADDITFSSMHNVFQIESDFIRELERIITQENFIINCSKTRLQKDGFRQEVTGLVVNKHVNVSKRFVSQIRRWMYYWESYGYNRAQGYFLKELLRDKKISKGKKRSLEEVLRGKIALLKMVKGSDDQVYKYYHKRFDELPRENSVSKEQIYVPNTELDVRHNPAEGVKILKYFKFTNEFAFKGLVHRPLSYDNFDFEGILRNADLQFDKISLTTDERLGISRDMFTGIKKFFSELREYGIPFFKRTNQHPLADRKVGLIIQEFKGNYRFGNERSESSIFSDLFINLAKKRSFTDHKTRLIYSFGVSDTSGLFSVSQIQFLPSLLKFQSKANFFTWVPAVRISLALIIDGMLQHSNIGGLRPFNMQDKLIDISINRHFENDAIKIELSILDRYSIFLGNTEDIMNVMRRDFLNALKGIADFKLQVDLVDGSAFEIRILPYADKPAPLNELVGGFKYIFTFYD